LAHYLFVDGAYFHTQFSEHMKELYGDVPKVDYFAISQHVSAQRTYYYDAIDNEKRSTETADQHRARVADARERHHHISRVPGFHVREGHVRRGGSRPREQKAVDVMLAVDAMEHASRGTVGTITLLAGDLDFEPLVSALVRMGVDTRIVYVRRHTAPEVLAAADSSQPLSLHNFYSFAASSFRSAHRAVDMLENIKLADLGSGSPVTRGSYDGKEVGLYTYTSGEPILWMAPGSELTDPSITFTHPDAATLLVAFKLTYGVDPW
jgi:uncharacterized LabA/DUF88 family protein